MQRKIEDRTTPDLASNSNLASVQFNDSLSDGQAHAGALDGRSLVPASIKLLKDHVLLHVVDSGTVVGNAGNHLTARVDFRDDMDGAGGGRVLSCVLQQMDKDFRIVAGGARPPAVLRRPLACSSVSRCQGRRTRASSMERSLRIQAELVWRSDVGGRR